MAATNGDDNQSNASTSSHLSFFGLNQCPRTDTLCGMKVGLRLEMERCQQLFDAVRTMVEDTNEFDDAALDSDSARDGLRDMVTDYIAFARQMTTDKVPGDPLRFAASSLRRLRRQWYAMRFFDLESYQEGFPSLANIDHARERYSEDNQHVGHSNNLGQK